MKFIPSNKTITLLFCLICSIPSAFADNHKTKVLVTIKPIEALVLAIAKDNVDIQRLLPDYASLHDYHFRPSDIKKINRADLIFRIDEDMESFLSPLLSTLKKTPIISLADTQGIRLLSMSDKDHHHKHNHHSQDDGDHHQHHANADFHIWMSPQNGLVMARKISQVLSKQNPQQADFYAKNLALLTQDTQQFIDDFSADSKAFNNKPYLVFHDAWHYFAEDFHLKKLATIALHADIQAGAKTIHHTRELIKNAHAVCLFTEPNFRPKTIKILIENLDIKTAEIDATASHIKVTPNLYLDLLRHTAQQIKQCLSLG